MSSIDESKVKWVDILAHSELFALFARTVCKPRYRERILCGGVAIRG